MLWTKSKTNEEVIQLARYRKRLSLGTGTIKSRQFKFFGHRIRADDLENRLLCGKIYSTRRRQCTKFTESFNKFMTNNEVIEKARNREEWRTMIVDVCKLT